MEKMKQNMGEYSQDYEKSVKWLIYLLLKILRN